MFLMPGRWTIRRKLECLTGPRARKTIGVLVTLRPSTMSPSIGPSVAIAAPPQLRTAQLIRLIATRVLVPARCDVQILRSPAKFDEPGRMRTVLGETGQGGGQ